MGDSEEARKALEALCAGGLAGPQERAWLLFQEAWPELFRMLKVALRSVGAPPRSWEDLGQTVMVKLWHRRLSFRGRTPGELQAWLTVIARNQMLDERRREAYEPSAASDLTPDPDGSRSKAIEAEPGREPNPAEETGRRQEEQRLGECIARLDDEERLVIEQHYAPFPVSLRSLAEVLRCSATRVRDLHRRALEKLICCLERGGAE